MTSTTTLRLNDTLRQRIARVAQAMDQTPHNFMLEALAQKADEAEWKLAMQHDAQQRDTALQAGEPGVEWHEMRAYLTARLHNHHDDKKKVEKAKIRPKARR